MRPAHAHRAHILFAGRLAYVPDGCTSLYHDLALRQKHNAITKEKIVYEMCRDSSLINDNCVHIDGWLYTVIRKWRSWYSGFPGNFPPTPGTSNSCPDSG